QMEKISYVYLGGLHKGPPQACFRSCVSLYQYTIIQYYPQVLLCERFVVIAKPRGQDASELCKACKPMSVEAFSAKSDLTLLPRVRAQSSTHVPGHFFVG